MQIKPLPPLNSLVAFEAAARHLSFTRAADELNVTQGAVSRQIKHLEEYLGRTLFIRDKRALYLTETGELYYVNVQQSLTHISSSTADIIKWKGDQQISIATTNAMASFWLLPRFAQFQKHHPDINLRIFAVDSIKQVRQGEFDLAMFFCSVVPKGLEATPLFRENVFPVCSPLYLANNPNISEPIDLINGTLLTLELAEDWVSWQAWFTDNNLKQLPNSCKRLNINNYLLVIQAALNGQGIALAWENLVDDYLTSGLLVKPVEGSMHTESQFYLLQPPQTLRPKKGVELFKTWLLESL
ncbi:LysR substrate-binding domain-containing protein [Gammaproteobacteria bacterium AS21]